MANRESVNEIFLPDKEGCLAYLREQRWSDEVACPHCGSADTIKKGTTRKDAQRYHCHNYDSISNNLTETIFRAPASNPGNVLHHLGDGRVHDRSEFSRA